MTDPKNLESWLHEKAGPAYDALKADPARAITPDQVRRTLDELLAEAEASGQCPLPPEQREWVDAPAVGREVLTPYDPAECLTSAEAVAAFLADAEATADPAYIQHACEVAARARAMHGLGPSSFRVEHNSHNDSWSSSPVGMCAGRWPACAHVHEACLIRRMSPWALP